MAFRREGGRGHRGQGPIRFLPGGVYKQAKIRLSVDLFDDVPVVSFGEVIKDIRIKHIDGLR